MPQIMCSPCNGLGMRSESAGLVHPAMVMDTCFDGPPLDVVLVDQAHRAPLAVLAWCGERFGRLHLHCLRVVEIAPWRWTQRRCPWPFLGAMYDEDAINEVNADSYARTVPLPGAPKMSENDDLWGQRQAPSHDRWGATRHAKSSTNHNQHARDLPRFGPQ